MGTLYIVSTPIGNLEDITIRAIRTLFSMDYIACEDTRKTGLLLKNYELRIKNQELVIRNLDITLHPKLISYYDEVELIKSPEIISLLESGKNVALVSDSGTPLISDPGYKLIKECLKKAIRIVPIPGPTSLITAMTVSGLPTNQFLFLGYLPAKQKSRKVTLNEFIKSFKTSYKFIYPTVVILESPHRLKETLSDLKDVFGDIEIVIARELTKIHEEIWRGKVSQFLGKSGNIKGEIVLCFNVLPSQAFQANH